MFVCLFLILATFPLYLMIIAFIPRWWVGWQDVLKRDGELGWMRLQLMLEEEED